ncbi:MAG: GntR family transcriptional regulator [Homoserinimonas sp.]|jgi:DNA-binding GntR family transcriptional regulator|nr:GntR family transcriptional regulator [Homoserinimonas sp.]
MGERQPGTTYADTVYDLLLGQFMDGKWEAGSQLNIPTLAREFEVSQTPIREALARLEHTGLVTREPLKGYHVAPLFSEHELVKLMDARLILEPALALEAARRVTPEFLDELKVTIDDLFAAAQTGSMHGHWSADDKFHALISKQSANPFLDAAYGSIRGQVRRFRLFAKLGPRTAEMAAHDHQAIFEALEARDPAGSAASMSRHITGARNRALEDRKSIT